MSETWIRARTPNQIEHRVRQILTAAERLLAENSLDDITMAMIAEEAGFTRSNLYRYFATKEEVFLAILEKDLTQWVEDLGRVLGSDPLAPDDFAERWISSLLANGRMLDLLAVLSTKLETGASVAALASFKAQVSELTRREAQFVQRIFPDLTISSTYRLLMFRSALIVGAYPAMNPTAKQREAMTQAGVPFAPDRYRDMTVAAVASFVTTTRPAGPHPAS